MGFQQDGGKEGRDVGEVLVRGCGEFLVRAMARTRIIPG